MYSCFFRTGGGKLQPEGTSDDKIEWNGKFAVNSKRPCVSFNKGTDHEPKHLTADGTCKFNHICMQWVTDKGPRGTCGGNHPFGQCNYDASKRSDKPASQ